MITKHPFEYQKPTEVQAAKMRVVNTYLKAAYEAIAEQVPANAERTLAVRKLQECRMWANAAIVLNEE